MKELLKQYAEYNAMTSKTLSELMLKVPQDKLMEKRNTYHQNLYNLYRHLIAGSWHYLNAVRYISEGRYSRELPDLPDESVEYTIEELNTVMLRLSEIFRETAVSISDEDLNTKKEKVEIYNGRIIDISVWQFFMQHITHQTHHQGQISIILDELDIEHEFGNIFPLIEDSV